MLGTVEGDSIGIYLGNDATLDSGQEVVVGANGVVSGGTGVILYGFNSSIINYGLISVSNNGVFIYGANASVTNHGVISADNSAVVIIGANAFVINSGLISGGEFGVNVAASAVVGEFRILNHGTIEGANFGVFFGEPWGDGVSL